MSLILNDSKNVLNKTSKPKKCERLLPFLLHKYRGFDLQNWETMPTRHPTLSINHQTTAAAIFLVIPAHMVVISATGFSSVSTAAANNGTFVRHDNYEHPSLTSIECLAR